MQQHRSLKSETHCLPNNSFMMSLVLLALLGALSASEVCWWSVHPFAPCSSRPVHVVGQQSQCSIHGYICGNQDHAYCALQLGSAGLSEYCCVWENRANQRQGLLGHSNSNQLCPGWSISNQPDTSKSNSESRGNVMSRSNAQRTTQKWFPSSTNFLSSNWQAQLHMTQATLKLHFCPQCINKSQAERSAVKLHSATCGSQARQEEHSKALHINPPATFQTVRSLKQYREQFDVRSQV